MNGDLVKIHFSKIMHNDIINDDRKVGGPILRSESFLVSKMYILSVHA
jgi:hypothetical protein